MNSFVILLLAEALLGTFVSAIARKSWMRSLAWLAMDRKFSGRCATYVPDSLRPSAPRGMLSTRSDSCPDASHW